MYLVAIGWLYVALMMAVAEADHANGSLLGAVVTFVLYGLLPVALVLYILGTPQRKRAIRAREQAERDAWQAQANAMPATPSDPPDTGREPAAAAEPDTVAPVRKEP